MRKVYPGPSAMCGVVDRGETRARAERLNQHGSWVLVQSRCCMETSPRPSRILDMVAFVQQRHPPFTSLLERHVPAGVACCATAE